MYTFVTSIKYINLITDCPKQQVRSFDLLDFDKSFDGF